MNQWSYIFELFEKTNQSSIIPLLLGIHKVRLLLLYLITNQAVPIDSEKAHEREEQTETMNNSNNSNDNANYDGKANERIIALALLQQDFHYCDLEDDDSPQDIQRKEEEIFAMGAKHCKL
ncbi:2818_t:CDS:2 [Ambispora gerdemannii]|uniref:2818_t:CDS:1 n=1 Tax=Ambispora gerdemannii TaxID=144530 RepID=A0A9N9AAS8_9GLOM|nr:2818_t:CDS:2 [Ambispora gerdemannii]